MIIVAETLASGSNDSQVVDLFANAGSDYTPGYAIYENGSPERVVLINFMDDPTGASDVVANVLVDGGNSGRPAATPSSVTVKYVPLTLNAERLCLLCPQKYRYLFADSVSEKFNITWAGQTMGGQFESDGRIRGQLDIVTIKCSNTTGSPIYPGALPYIRLLKSPP